MPDRSSSVIARLRNKSIETGKPLQLYLQLLCQEEFLRRVSMSDYAGNLVLKGGLFVYAITNFESRATVDVDFLLRQLPNSIEEVRKVVENILVVDTGNDFISLIANNFEPISIHKELTGISFQMIGRIKNTKTPFSVDFGFGDIIVPGSQLRKIPVQLDEFTVPYVMTYSLESTIAEKFEALLQRMELTSRMKDIYDIFYLSNSFNFDGWLLQQALGCTLTNRLTAYSNESLKKVTALAQSKIIQNRWHQFFIRTKLPSVPLAQALAGISDFLGPVWSAIIDQEVLLKTWSAKEARWQ